MNLSLYSEPIMNDFVNTLTKYKWEIINLFVKIDVENISNRIIKNRNKSIKF